MDLSVKISIDGFTMVAMCARGDDSVNECQ